MSLSEARVFEGSDPPRCPKNLQFESFITSFSRQKRMRWSYLNYKCTVLDLAERTWAFKLLPSILLFVRYTLEHSSSSNLSHIVLLPVLLNSYAWCTGLWCQNALIFHALITSSHMTLLQHALLRLEVRLTVENLSSSLLSYSPREKLCCYCWGDDWRCQTMMDPRFECWDQSCYFDGRGVVRERMKCVAMMKLFWFALHSYLPLGVPLVELARKQLLCRWCIGTLGCEDESCAFGDIFVSSCSHLASAAGHQVSSATSFISSLGNFLHQSLSFLAQLPSSIPSSFLHQFPRQLPLSIPLATSFINCALHCLPPCFCIFSSSSSSSAFPASQSGFKRLLICIA